MKDIKWAIMDEFWILRYLKKCFDVVILNTISKFSKIKNLTKKRPPKVSKMCNNGRILDFKVSNEVF